MIYGRLPPSKATAIVVGVASQASVTLAEIVSVTRERRVARARQQAFLELRRAGMSYPQIGLFMQRDHSTVISGVRAAEKREALS